MSQIKIYGLRAHLDPIKSQLWDAMGSICLSAFIVVGTWLSAPMVPLKLFRSRTFSGTNLLTLLLYAALINNAVARVAGLLAIAVDV